MRAIKGQVTDAIPQEVLCGETGRIDGRRLAGLKRQAKGMAADDGVPREEIAGETTRLDATAISSLLEKSEGTTPLAVGTPGEGLPQLASDEPEITVAETQDADASEVAPARRRTRELLVGGALSIVVMIAWLCATHL